VGGVELAPELLTRIRARAAGYDRENVFFSEDLAELADAGYLRPRPLLEAARDQRLLAAHAPATALGLAMHLVVVGIARILAERGDHSLDWILTDAENGELFAFGNSEAGNDQVMFDSLTTATPGADGSYSFTGTKIFTSMSPAWTRLSVFGRHDDELVHGIITRDTPGWRNLGDWDTLGMRATQSYTTVLDGAVVPKERITRILPVGPSSDPYVFGLFAGFLLLVSSVYAGIADRALELGVAAAQRRTSLKTGLSYAADPDIRFQLADAAIALDSLGPQIESLASDVDGLVNHGGDWFRYLVGTKTRVVDASRSIVETALRASGGSSYTAGSELSRLYRDALAGLFQPSDPESAHSTIANNLLGEPPTRER
jgi:alkylation response protein AidB-like acyl-CoA dehydrogenase